MLKRQSHLPFPCIVCRRFSSRDSSDDPEWGLWLPAPPRGNMPAAPTPAMSFWQRTGNTRRIVTSCMYRAQVFTLKNSMVTSVKRAIQIRITQETFWDLLSQGVTVGLMTGLPLPRLSSTLKSDFQKFPATWYTKLSSNVGGIG